jgi:hypothetical protein
MEMLGFLIGLLCGAFELFLLHRIIRAVTENKTGLILLFSFLKLVVLAGAFIPVIVFLRSDLLWCGIGTACSLVGGSFVIFLKNTKLKGGNKN